MIFRETQATPLAERVRRGVDKSGSGWLAMLYRSDMGLSCVEPRRGAHVMIMADKSQEMSFSVVMLPKDLTSS